MKQDEGAIKKILTIAVVGEAITGVALIVLPAMLVRLLFGMGIAGAGVVMCRIAGIALIGLGMACLPGGSPNQRAFAGMLTYSMLATLYLAFVGLSGTATGILLWPAVGGHVLISVLLVLARGKQGADPRTTHRAAS